MFRGWHVQTCQPRFSLLLRSDPRRHQFVQHIKWDCAVSQHDIVELTHIEAAPQFQFTPAAQLLNFQFANLVGQRLSGPCDIAIDFVFDVQHGFGGIAGKKVDGLLAPPF